jgi:RHS repeat-associated protein
VIVERRVTLFSYDARGRLVRTLGPIDVDSPAPSDVVPVEERSYWPDGETLARRGRLQQVKMYPAPGSTPLVTSYDYDAFGPYLITYPDGGTMLTVRDGRGRPTVVVQPGGAISQTRYYDGHSPRIQILPTGAALRSSYGAMGQLVALERFSRDPDATGDVPVLGWSEHHAYDAAGNRVHSERRDATGAVVWQSDRQFDVQHRMVKELNPSAPGAARTTAYDASGFLSGVVDEEGRSLTFTPDGIGRVTKVRRAGLDANGAPVGLDVATYVYGTPLSTPTSVTGGKNVTNRYTYDDFGNVTSVSTPNARIGKASYSYDARGNLLQRKFAYVTETYTYDGMDRILTRAASNTVDGASVSIAYRYDEDGNSGRLTSIVEPGRTVTYSYDAAGRVARESALDAGSAVPLVSSYGYDADGHLTDLVYPSGLRVRYVIDAASGAVSEVRNAETGAIFATQISWMPAGPLRSLQFGNGAQLAQTFNLSYEPATIQSGPLELAYVVSGAGNLEQVSEAGVTRGYSYDFLDRLIGSDGWLSYAYDGNGNRTSEVVDGASATYTVVSTSDVLTKKATSGGVGLYAFAYDYQSNVSAIGKYNAAGTAVASTMCLRHDPLGRLVLVGPRTNASIYPNGTACFTDAELKSTVARFRYDALNRRIARWTGSTNAWTFIVSDSSGRPLGELGQTSDPVNPWQPIRDYVWLGGLPLAQIEYAQSGSAVGGHVNYYHADHLGQPRALTNANAQVVWSSTSFPYGEVSEATTLDPLSGRTVVTNLRLPGQYDERLLGPVGLQGPYYNWNRWYLPGVGRYLEPDPLALRGGWNTRYGVDWYGYAFQNPLTWTDPRGESPSCGGKCDLAQCLSACKASGEGLRQFCRGLPDPRLRAACWGLEFSSEVACNGWCYWNCT